MLGSVGVFGVTRHLLMDRFDQTECGLPPTESARTGEIDCEYCLNGRRHPRAHEHVDYHRAQLEALARSARTRADSGDAPEGGAGFASSRLLRVSEADLATLREWNLRLKYASRSAVADFKPSELAEIAGVLSRLVE